MSARLLIISAIALASLVCLATAQNQPGRKPDQTADLLAKLRKPIDLAKIDSISLKEFAVRFGETIGTTILINEAAFKGIDPDANPGGMEIKVQQFKALSPTTILNHLLSQLDATFLIYKDHIAIVPIAFAAKETKNVASTEDDESVRLAEPLVSMIFKEKPLNDAVAELAEEYNLTVVVSPQSADARTGFVSARLLNTPADKALELLALQCDLRIVRKANAYMITSRDHANDLFNERLERERNKIELDRLRNTPIFPPQPQPQPQPQPVPTPNPVPPPKNP